MRRARRRTAAVPLAASASVTARTAARHACPAAAAAACQSVLSLLGVGWFGSRSRGQGVRHRALAPMRPRQAAQELCQPQRGRAVRVGVHHT
eukprot:2946549-Pleurochrysis_carterae.AAC.1